MKIIEWLKNGDVTIKYLVNKNLLNNDFSHENKGFIGKYISLYDKEKKYWGEGIYSPIWTSSHYTLLELKYMEIDHNHPVYQESTLKLLDGLWYEKGFVNGKRQQDMCMSAMLLSIITYGRFKDERINEIIDYILEHQLFDGGWNCAWNSVHNQSNKSSLHTTISVLEALRDYEKYGYSYRLAEIKRIVLKAQEYLLKRELFMNSKGNVINQDMVAFNYPTRWKYDCFRALEYFASISKEYDKRMEEALELVRVSMKKGYITKGKQYPGKVHFKLEEGLKGRFNTYRALLILKKYDNLLFKQLITL